MSADLKKSNKYIILSHQLHLLSAPRRISLMASGGVIYFVGDEYKRESRLRSQYLILEKEGI